MRFHGRRIERGRQVKADTSTNRCRVSLRDAFSVLPSLSPLELKAAGSAASAPTGGSQPGGSDQGWDRRASIPPASRGSPEGAPPRQLPRRRAWPLQPPRLPPGPPQPLPCEQRPLQAAGRLQERRGWERSFAGRSMGEHLFVQEGGLQSRGWGVARKPSGEAQGAESIRGE